MTEAEKQKLIAQFGLRLGGLIQQLGATIQAIKPERPALAAVPEAG